MERNVGGYDRTGRLLFGPVLLVVGAAILLGVVSLDAGRLAIVVGVIAAAVGAVFLLTAGLRWCPINALAGFDTGEGRKTTDRSADEVDRGTRGN